MARGPGRRSLQRLDQLQARLVGACLLGLLGGGVGAARGEGRHLAAGDDIRVEGDVLGSIDHETVDRALGERGREVERCYREGQSRLRYLGGSLEVRVRVLPDGRVKRASVSVPIGSLAVERCVVEALRALRLPPPRGNLEAEFTYAWSFRSPSPTRDWGAEEVAPRIRPYRAALLACAPSRAALRVTFYVLPGGRVGSVGIGSDGPLDEQQQACLAARLGEVRFDDPRGVVARVALGLRQ